MRYSAYSYAMLRRCRDLCESLVSSLEYIFFAAKSGVIKMGAVLDTRYHLCASEKAALLKRKAAGGKCRVRREHLRSSHCKCDCLIASRAEVSRSNLLPLASWRAHRHPVALPASEAAS